MNKIPTPHIEAKEGEIAKTVIMAVDPLRAKFMAEKYLDNPTIYNQVRGMFGYTGTYKGKRVSIQGHGMGIPSIGIYTYELFNFYDVDTIIRVGSAGAIDDDLNIDNLYSSDTFYDDDENSLKQWQKMGVLAVEMEAPALYMNAARAGKKALCICTISDCPFKNIATTSEQRQTGFTNMMEVALALI